MLALVVLFLLMVVHGEAGEAGEVGEVAVSKEKNLKFEIVLSSFQTPNHMTYLSYVYGF